MLTRALASFFGRAARGTHPISWLRPAPRLLPLDDRLTPAGPMYPNLQVYQPDMPSGNVTVDASHNIRFTTSLANAGLGAFDLRETSTVRTNSDGTQDILTNQRVYNDDNNNGHYDVGV